MGDMKGKRTKHENGCWMDKDREEKREVSVVSEVEVNKGSVRQAGLITYLLRDKHQPGAWLYCPNPCREKRGEKLLKQTKTWTSGQHLFISFYILISPDLSFLITCIIHIFSWSQCKGTVGFYTPFHALIQMPACF